MSPVSHGRHQIRIDCGEKHSPAAAGFDLIGLSWFMVPRYAYFFPCWKTACLPRPERKRELSGGEIADWRGQPCSMGSRLRRVLRCLSVYAISLSRSLQAKDYFGCLPIPRSSTCSEQFQLCVKTIIIIKSHAPLPRPVTSMEQMGRGLESARVFPPSVQRAWSLQKGLFLFFPLAPLYFSHGVRDRLQLENRGQGLKCGERRKLFCLLPVCRFLFTRASCREKPGWEQAGEGNWFFGSPFCICWPSASGLRPTSELSLVGSSKSYVPRKLSSAVRRIAIDLQIGGVLSYRGRHGHEHAWKLLLVLKEPCWTDYTGTA